jgi:PAS domain S-box-containing protein
VKKHPETTDDLIRESDRLKEMIREDMSWYQVKLSCNSIFDSIQAGISITDTEGNYTFMNQVAAGRIGLKPDQVIGKNYAEIWGEKEAELFRHEILNPVLDHGMELNSRRSVRLDNKVFWLDFKCLPVRDEFGAITGVLNMTFDVTLEEKRKKYSEIQEKINFISLHAKTLEESIVLIFNAFCQLEFILSGGIYFYDPAKDSLELVNHYNLEERFLAHVRSYGRDTINFRIVEKGLPHYDVVSELERERQDFMNSMGHRKICTIPMINESSLIGCITFSLNEDAEFTEEDKTFIETISWRIARLVALIRSGERFRETNRELIATISELREKQQMLIRKSKLESLGELSAGMAHEINQPLIVISLSIENIMQKMIAGKKNLSVAYLQKKFESILHNVSRIKQIVDNMRTFARDQPGIIFEKVNIAGVIERTLTLVRVQYRSEGIKLAISQDDDALSIVGNPYKLEQVIINLMSNSRYAVNEKEIRSGPAYQKEIMVRVTNTGNIATIEVRDNGIGIPEENMERLFTPFFTTRKEGEGTGLGLSIVYGIVKELNGDINVDSIVNEYTSFRVSFPAV